MQPRNVVEEMAIPPPGEPLDPTTESPTLAYYYQNAENMMLHGEREADWDFYHSTTAYQDPNLDDASVMVEVLVKT